LVSLDASFLLLLISLTHSVLLLHCSCSSVCVGVPFLTPSPSASACLDISSPPPRTFPACTAPMPNCSCSSTCVGAPFPTPSRSASASPGAPSQPLHTSLVRPVLLPPRSCSSACGGVPPPL